MAAPYGAWLRALDRGWITINGERARMTEEAYLDQPGWMRFRIVFERPYPYPHP